LNRPYSVFLYNVGDGVLDIPYAPVGRDSENL
jgi:hypothetical protein